MNPAAESILQFVELAIARRRRALSAEDRARIEALDEQLREVIDGSHPAPKHIEGRAISPPAAPPASSQAQAPAQKRGANVKQLAERLEISAKDRKKLNEVNAEDIPVSHYTPPSAPAFLSDYYNEAVVPISVPRTALPRAMIRADAGELEIPREVRVLFGVEKPIAVPNDRSAATDPKRRGTPPPRSASELEAAAKRKPVIVHLLAGGTKRGQIDAFDPSSGAIELFEETGESSRIALPEVLAVFFGQKRGEEGSVPTGDKVIVRLVNDRQVSGMTEDYREGGDSLTLTPEQKRGNVDRVWIPAWAVKEIHLG
jgi:hypothetical protein